MTLRQPVLDRVPITSRSGVYRLKALCSEALAKESTDPKSRQDWEELAMEWHIMANLAGSASDEISPNEVAGQ